jgi:hypothetical protein
MNITLYIKKEIIKYLKPVLILNSKSVIYFTGPKDLDFTTFSTLTNIRGQEIPGVLSHYNLFTEEFK